MAERNAINDARDLRQRQTKAESLLWNVLRAKQLCGLKFRRQHPETPFILDFACVAHMLAVEIDGGYHDGQFEKDEQRDRFLVDKGWGIIRFTNEDVLADVEAVTIAIARHLKLDYQYIKRKGGLSSVADRQRNEKDKQCRTKLTTPSSDPHHASLRSNPALF